MPISRTVRSVLWSAALLAAFAAPSRAEWPEKPVTIAVGFGAGGTNDIVARAVAELLAKLLGQPVVVENKPGAGGAVAATALARMPADGYNLVATTSTTVTLDPQLMKLGFTPADFTYVAAIGEFPEAFVALPKHGWKNLSDAMAAAKATGRMNYASNTALDRMISAAIAKKAGVSLVPVPTRSGAEVVTQVMGGHVDLGYSSGAYYPQAKSGDLAVMAVLGDKRVAGLPDVPTLKELGYGVSSVNLVLFIAPKGLPSAVAKKLDDAFAAAGKDPSIVALMENRSLNAVVETGATLDATIKRHIDDFAKLIEASK